jgi:hypothetical protein
LQFATRTLITPKETPDPDPNQSTSEPSNQPESSTTLHSTTEQRSSTPDIPPNYETDAPKIDLSLRTVETRPNREAVRAYVM